MTEGYCVRCHKKQEIQNPQEIEMKKKGGKIGKAVTGSCPVCGTKMFRILSSKPVENPEIPKTETTSTPESPNTDLGTENPSVDATISEEKTETAEQEAKTDEAVGDAEKAGKEMEDFDIAGE